METDKQKLVTQQDDCELLNIHGPHPDTLQGAEYVSFNTAQNMMNQNQETCGVISSPPRMDRGYEAPPQYGPTGVQYGQPGVQYGQPGMQYGQPRMQYGQPGVQCGRPQQQVVVATMPSQMTTAPPDNYGCVLCFAIFTCLFCCWPLGIAAIIYACRARDNSLMGHYQLAQSSGSTSRVLSIIALVIGLLIWVPTIAYSIYITVVMTTAVNDMMSNLNNDLESITHAPSFGGGDNYDFGY